jgi:F-box protein 18 (helicase)
LNPTSSDVIKIVAFAGTGKTTTLIHLCKENPGLKFLVVMYNRSEPVVVKS